MDFPTKAKGRGGDNLKRAEPPFFIFYIKIYIYIYIYNKKGNLFIIKKLYSNPKRRVKSSIRNPYPSQPPQRTKEDPRLRVISLREPRVRGYP